MFGRPFVSGAGGNASQRFGSASPKQVKARLERAGTSLTSGEKNALRSWKSAKKAGKSYAGWAKGAKPNTVTNFRSGSDKFASGSRPYTRGGAAAS